MALAQYLPWWAKITTKLALARLPISYDFWRKIGLFRHGEMNVPDKAIKTYDAYYQRARKYIDLPDNFHSLELGPGDSVLTGLVSRSYGAECAWLVDAGAFAETNIEACTYLLEKLKSVGRQVPDISKPQNLESLLENANVKYLTNGTSSLCEIPDHSVDFCWSQVVLEHVPYLEFPEFVAQLHRVLSKDGIGVHSIDFRDHLGGGLNNLRFSERLWESSLFHNSGFYTNRIRPRVMIDMFKAAGFDVEIIHEMRWPQMPISRSSLAEPFKGYVDEDFMVREIEIITRPK